MSIDQLKDRIPDFAKDVRLNLASMMADETQPSQSKYGLLLASAIATRNPIVTAAMEVAAGVVMTPAAVEAAKSAASVIAMNNLYYRICSSRLQPGVQGNARTARDEWAWQSSRGQSRFRAVGAGGKRNQWVWCLHGPPMRRRCGSPESARR